MERVTWQEVEPAARLAFRVWVNQPELSWAQQAWHVLASVGLTEYDDYDLAEPYRVYFRLFVLGGVYRDFCDRAWEEVSDNGYRDYTGWADELGLDVRVMWAIALRREAGEWNLNEDDFAEMVDQGLFEEDERFAESPLDDVLRPLVEAERRGVVAALKKELGGTNLFFASLWRSKGDGSYPFDGGSTPSALTQRAFAWVSEGCPEL